MLKQFQNMVDELISTTKRTDKENILKKYEKCPYIKELLEFIFNPYKVTGISTKKINKYRNLALVVTSIKTPIELISYFTTHTTGKEEDILNLVGFANSIPEYKDLIYSIVSKDLKLGIQATTINKVYGNSFVPTFDVMLAEKYYDNPKKWLPEGTDYMLSTKLDGVRCICLYYDKDRIEFFSRQGQLFTQMYQIEEEVKEYLEPGFAYDGELLLKDDSIELSKDLYRATVKITNFDGVKEDLTFNIFDCLPIVDFQTGKSKMPCRCRKAKLENLFSCKNPKYLKNVITLYWGKDQKYIQEYLDKITAEGGEGVMINIADAPYECKRTTKLLKVKKMQTADVLVTGITEGSGLNKGRLGSIIIKFIGPDGKEYNCECGSGFKQDERIYYWNNPDEIINKIVEIQYFEITNNQSNDNYSMRFPIFKYLREDKTEISMH